MTYGRTNVLLSRESFQKLEILFYLSISVSSQCKNDSKIIGYVVTERKEKVKWKLN
jgi:hypothetical protein